MFFHSLGLISKVAVGLKNKPCLEVGTEVSLCG